MSSQPNRSVTANKDAGVRLLLISVVAGLGVAAFGYLRSLPTSSRALFWDSVFSVIHTVGSRASNFEAWLYSSNVMYFIWGSLILLHLVSLTTLYNNMGWAVFSNKKGSPADQKVVFASSIRSMHRVWALQELIGHSFLVAFYLTAGVAIWKLFRFETISFSFTDTIISVVLWFFFIILRAHEYLPLLLIPKKNRAPEYFICPEEENKEAFRILLSQFACEAHSSRKTIGPGASVWTISLLFCAVYYRQIKSSKFSAESQAHNLVSQFSLTKFPKV